MHDRKLVFLTLASTLILWGSSFPVIKIALLQYTPIQVATIRFIFASLTLLFFCYKINFRAPTYKELLLFFTLAIVGVYGYHLLLNYGESLTNAGTAGFIVNLAPIFSILLSRLLFKEKITNNKLFGTAISLIGVWLIIKSSNTNLAINQGIIFLIFAALAWSLFFIIQKILLQQYSSIEIACYTIWLGTAMFIAFHNPFNTLQHAINDSPITSLIACAYLGIFATSAAYWLWAYTLKRIEVSKAAIYTYCVPFISAILSFYLVGELYNKLFWVGGSCIIGGMLIANGLNWQLTIKQWQLKHK